MGISVVTTIILHIVINVKVVTCYSATGSDVSFRCNKQYTIGLRQPRYHANVCVKVDELQPLCRAARCRTRLGGSASRRCRVGL